jgi:hypothetical protein
LASAFAVEEQDPLQRWFSGQIQSDVLNFDIKQK